MKRLLCIVGSMNAGGAETFLMKVYRKLDKDKYQMDFVVAVKEEGFYDNEINDMGGKIYHVTPKSESSFKNFKDIKKIVKDNNYKSVLRVSQNSLSALELYAARLGGAKKLAYRSSNSNVVSGSKKQLIVHKACMFMPRLFANIRFAPSSEAAKFMFGKNSLKNNKAFILNNGIDYTKYKYSKEGRNRIRDEFKIKEDDLLIGHVGRFNKQKNHKFLLDIFKEIKNKNGKSKLMLVGEGELLEEIKKYANELGIIDDIILTGIRKDVSDLLSAMDVYVFPSFYEGMPNTVIEAQATGLPCIVSNRITKEAKITDLVIYKNLEDKAEEWAELAVSMKNKDRLVSMPEEYDINYVVKKFIEVLY